MQSSFGSYNTMLNSSNLQKKVPYNSEVQKRHNPFLKNKNKFTCQNIIESPKENFNYSQQRSINYSPIQQNDVYYNQQNAKSEQIDTNRKQRSDNQIDNEQVTYLEKIPLIKELLLLTDLQNENGEIGQNEFIQILQNFQIKPQDAQQIFQKINGNYDGIINFEDLVFGNVWILRRPLFRCCQKASSYG
ncbi:hypothetical protein PPERSA_01766 [Pseudocohnilembus persalinus]|uniref:EF-hand domain-containing protein n=1 Tax=Pseudocohnilembus persalinus TaxID=266149 RepID=A0A0V0R1D4_PSEPJ|nr:hypothetical protein PPERSA_01766 [Pseudocohnilembus persalinus]|eukprot:KRX08305.1 hypothetical protein PPERSA_01766 [Pseudocohnilembus persalinus]